jgi:hypothetical protein
LFAGLYARFTILTKFRSEGTAAKRAPASGPGIRDHLTWSVPVKVPPSRKDEFTYESSASQRP